MSQTGEQSLGDAFSYLLRDLCIDEFPCGNGKWRSGNTWRCESPDLLHPSKDPDASKESIQSLIEISSNEPFSVKVDWSEDIDKIRNLAITDPEKISKNNVFKYFSSLRLVGMNINCVDESLLKFVHLKEVVLSANFIENINLRNIPKALEVLELYGNRLSDIQRFCCSLPDLKHFGVGRNHLSKINGAIHSKCWSNILSLDLSFNSLTGLRETLETLKYLPRLGNLLLLGNPLFLAASYRGLTVDTLKQLSVLDDFRITADEKHRYKGICKIKGISYDEAVVEIQFSCLKGIKMPHDPQNDANDEFPRIEYRYQISYPFLIEATVKKEPKRSLQVIENGKDPNESGQEMEDRVSASETDDDIAHIDAAVPREGDYLLTRKTRERTWSEEGINISHGRKLACLDLTHLKKFFMEEISLQLIENKVVVSLDPPDENASVIGDSDPDKNNKGGKSKAKEKPKQPPAPKPNAAKSRRKNKGEELPLYELSRESKNIAELSLSLKDFLQGTKFFEKQSTFTLNEANFNEGDQQNQEESKDSKMFTTKYQSTGEGKSKGKESRKQPSPANSTTGQRNKSALSLRPGKGDKQDKNSKVKDSKHLTEILEVEQQPPPEITLDIVISLNSWANVKEAQDWYSITQ